MSYLMKKQNRNKLYIIMVISVLGVGSFIMFNDIGGMDLIGTATGLFNFASDEGVQAQCSLEASLGAYDSDENPISTKNLQSGYYIGGVEVAFIRFDIELTLVGTNVDWNTLNATTVDLIIYPNGQDEIHTGDDLLTGDSIDVLGENVTSVNIRFTIWDEDFAPTSPIYNWYLADILGEPVKSLEDGTDIFLLQMVFNLEMSVMDAKNNILNSGVDVVGTWEINTLPDGTFDITINTGTAAINDTYLDVDIIEIIESDDPIVSVLYPLVDDDLAPDVGIYPSDTSFVNV